MKKLLVALSVFASFSAFAADSGSIQGRIARYTVDNSPSLSQSGNLTFVKITIKDVCPIYPGIYHSVSKVSDQVAILEISLSEHATCGNRRADMTFVDAVDVKSELASVGLDPNKSQLVITLK